MIVLETIAVALSMFTVIPMPAFEWNERNMKYMLCAFPTAGCVIGALLAAVGRGFETLGLPTMITAATMTLIPFFVTGGIHYEGFADTWDAIASHKGADEKYRIMKDPHIGAFAVMHLCAYFLWMFVLWCVMPEIRILPVFLMFVLSRILSGIAVLSFPASGREGLVTSFAENAGKGHARAVLIVMDTAVLAVLCTAGIYGIAVAAAAHIVYVCFRHMVKVNFGGISGDLSGWFVAEAEKWMLTVLVVLELLIK